MTASQLMDPQTGATSSPASAPGAVSAGSSPPEPSRGDSAVRELIAAARRTPQRAPARGAWLLAGLTGLLFWLSFTPVDFGPLGWIALTPLILLVRLPERTRWMYPAVAVIGSVTMTACLQWMRLGDVTMYPAWLLLAVYCGLYFPLFLALTRCAVHRWQVPLSLAVPVMWVGLEYARAHLLTGFAWYFLGHTQYRWLELIQISDLCGAYGVSFLLAMTAAVLAGLVPRQLFVRLKLVRPDETTPALSDTLTRRQVIGVAVCLLLFAAALGYGYVRRSQADFQAGPRVALIQGNFVSEVKHDPAEATRIFIKHRQLTDKAALHQPDFIVWPETMHRDPLVSILPGTTDADLRRVAGVDPQLIRERSKRLPQLLGDFCKRPNAAMIIGLESVEIGPQGQRHYNSAAFCTPPRGYVNRYDKIHRVPFGEYVPFQKQFPWLGRFTPFREGFGINAGSVAAVFEYKGYRCTPVICFEDTVPHLVRRIVKAAAAADAKHPRIDFLVNLTNDGWFHGSSELDQHLITAVFRSVELRTPMVRAVNTGISAFIDGDGAVLEPEVFLDDDSGERTSLRDPQTGRWRKSLNAVLVHNVPLDSRRSLYLWWGDWFAGLCAALAAMVVLGTLFFRPKQTAAATATSG